MSPKALSLAWLVVAGAAGQPAQEAPESLDTRGSIRQMQRLNVDEGWVLTDRALLFTRDGGATWSDLAPGQPLDRVSDAFFDSPTHAWLAGVAAGSPDRLAVLDTSDAGASWRQQEVPASALANGQVYARARVHFSDAAHGWLVGQVATSAAFSLGELLRTTDGGATWERLPRPPAAGRVVFVDAERGFMTGAPVSERFYRTLDGGETWHELNLTTTTVPGIALYDLPVFSSAMEGTLAVTVRGRIPRLLSFVTHDGGQSWRRVAATALPIGDYDEPAPAALGESGDPAAFAAQGSVTLAPNRAPRTLSLARGAGRRGARPEGSTPSVRALSLIEGGAGWALVAEGSCDAGECRQVTRVVALDDSAAAVRAVPDLLVRTEASRAAEPDQALTFGATTSFDKGFDKCAAPTTAQMQTWRTASPYKDANIYFGGSARACSQVNLSAGWVSAVFDQGWRLVPTWVGPQAPCTGFGTRFSSDPATARNQALAEAEAAVNGASVLGLGAGTPLYYDLELYAENNPSCSAAVRAFVDAWTERVRGRGYLAGVYGNARNAQADWRTGVIASPPDAVWLTPWVCSSTATACNWSPTVFGIPGLSDAYWATNQRIRQYWGAHNETYGGATFNIDSDFANAPVAGGSAPPPSCLATVPPDHWRGEYFANQTLSGAPAMVRDDGVAALSFDWVSGSPSSSCGIGVDHFSVRWTRTLSFSAGTYRFNTRTDDGVRLYVDGVLKIDRWIDRAASPDTVDVTLGAGNHTLRLEYYENGGFASAELSWQAISNPCVGSVASDHWRGEYFSNQTLSGTPAMVRDDGIGGLSFNWDTGSPSSACGIGADHFSARWTRTVTFSAGTYRFNTRTDDGVRLYVDGVLKIDRWIDRAASPDTVDVTLGAGNHTLRLEYYENGGLASAELSWQAISNPCVGSVASDHWRGEYFSNQTLSGTPAMVRDDGTGGLSFNWDTGSPSSACGIGADHFSARWTRTLSFTAGAYHFETRTDDGVRLYIDDVLRIDQWSDRAAPNVPDSVDLTLGAGNHTLRLEYYENGGLASAELSWRPAGLQTLTKKVMLLIYNPILESQQGQKLTTYRGWNDPDQLTTQLIANMAEVSGGHVSYVITSRVEEDDIPVKTDLFDYDDATYLQCLSDHSTCHSPDEADYAKLLDKLGVCAKLNDGSIDELWMWGGPWFGFYESRLAGPASDVFFYNSPPLVVPACNRPLPIMGFSYERGNAEALHSFGHRAEAAVTHAFGGWDVTQSRHDWDRYGHNRGQTPGVAFYECGSVHYPPNAPVGQEYAYANAEAVPSNCNDWRNYPNFTGTTESFGCSQWGCSQEGYMKWWLGHLPRVDGQRDGRLNDWWLYVVDHRFGPKVTAFSSEYLPGWASNILDGKHGQCNDGEWATSGQPTGWVQIQVGRSLKGISVYDRACPERVVRGHIELSSGETFGFGFTADPGQDGGLVPATTSFTVRYVAWVKVFIDESVGGPNPGIGEVVLEFGE